jgi:hypothetical protein
MNQNGSVPKIRLSERFISDASKSSKDLTAKNQEEQKKASTAALAFGPLLPCNHELESVPLASDSPDLRTRKDQWMAEKYRQLLMHAKTSAQRSVDQLNQVLAMWLKDEGIISPQEFLPKDMFSGLTKTISEVFGSYRPAEKHYADLVEAWLPYFEHLMDAYQLLLQRKEKQIGKKLKEAGYDTDAIRIIVHQPRRTRTALPAAIQFVAHRNERLDENTIRTAHSRIYGRIRKNFHR